MPVSIKLLLQFRASITVFSCTAKGIVVDVVEILESTVGEILAISLNRVFENNEVTTTLFEK
jgi:hypothetical protein